MKELIMYISIVIVMVFAYMDTQDRELEHNHYCDMVSQGHWPNYNNVECE